MIVTILIVIYFLGVVKCRKIMIKDDAFGDDFVDIIICFMPCFHWLFIALVWWENKDIGNGIVNKFFGRK